MMRIGELLKRLQGSGQIPVARPKSFATDAGSQAGKHTALSGPEEVATSAPDMPRAPNMGARFLAMLFRPICKAGQGGSSGKSAGRRGSLRATGPGPNKHHNQPNQAESGSHGSKPAKPDRIRMTWLKTSQTRQNQNDMAQSQPNQQNQDDMAQD